MKTIWHDIRFGVRTLVKKPGFVLVTVLTLAVGIGANAAVFSLINGWILRPLPGQRDGRLVRLYNRSTKADGAYRWFSYPSFIALRKENHSFTGVSAYCPTGLAMLEQGITRTAIGAYVSSDFFRTFGIVPSLGHCFTETQEQPGSHVPVALISHRFWQGLGGDPSVIGRSLILNDTPVSVVGVLPPTFLSASQITNRDVWLPLGMMGGFSSQKQKPLSAIKLMLIGQLKAGLTPASATPDLNKLAADLATSNPAEYGDCTITARPIGHTLMSPAPGDGLAIGRPLTALIAVSVTLWLIACLNLANMFLAWGTTRQREISIRLALGSSRLRIVRQLATEGLLLSLMGAVIGLTLALWSIRIPIHYFERWTGGEGTIPTELDWRLLTAGGVLCVFSTLLFSLVPAWRLLKNSQMTHLRESTTSSSAAQTWWRRVTITTQTALAFTLVACAGLFVESARSAAQADLGFALDRSLLIELSFKKQGSMTFRDVMTRLRSLPGLQSVSASSIPFGEASQSRAYQCVGALPSEPSQSLDVHCHFIGTDYFKSLDVPLLSGREFTLIEEQSNQEPRVALIDEALAQRLWPHEDPVGQYLQNSRDSETVQIVGIVPDLKHNLVEPQTQAHIYLTMGQQHDSHVFIHAQCASPVTPAALGAMKRVILKELQALDPFLPIRGIRTWQEHIEHFSFQSFTIKLAAKFFATLAILALGLAGVGLFGVKSTWVARRTREIGIQMALGATKRNILWQVVTESMSTVLIGLSTGLLLTWISTRFIEILLFEIKGTDPVVLLISMFVLITAVLLACYLPARRAAKIDPMQALRYE